MCGTISILNNSQQILIQKTSFQQFFSDGYFFFDDILQKF